MGNQTRPTVSVIIPTYNRAHLIREALESVFAQTFRSYEAIVIDDGSTDATRELLKPYGKRIRYVYQENQGISAARNRGISLSKGRYIAFLDSDDIWFPEKLKRQVAYLDQHPTIGLLYGRMRYTFAGKNGKERIVPEKAFTTVEELLTESNCIPTSCAIVRKRCVEQAGPFDVTLPIAEDFDLWLRIGRSYQIGFQDEILGEHRRHAQNTTQNLEKVYRGYWKLYEKVLKEFGSELRNRSSIQDREVKFRYLLGTHLLKSGRPKEAVGLIVGALRKNWHLGTLFAKEGDPVWKKLFLSVKPYAAVLVSLAAGIWPSRKPNTILIADSSGGWGGSAKYLLDLLNALKGEEFAIELLVYRKGPFFEKIATAGFRPKRVPLLRYPWFERRTDLPYFLKGVVTAIQFSVAVPWLCIFLWRRRVKVVHLNNEISSHLPLILASWLMRCRLLCHLHGWRPLTRLEKAVAGLIDLYVGITHRGTHFYRQQHPRGRYVTVPNGIRFRAKENGTSRLRMREKVGIENGWVCLGMIGRLIPLKGQGIFLETLRNVLAVQPRTSALIVGGDGRSSGYLKGLKEQARRLGIQDNIHFTGWQKDVESYLAAMDVVVHASVEPESFGLVIAEAMAQGKPVVATDGGGVPELIQDHVTGLLVKPNDPDRLSEALLELMRDRTLAVKIAKAGREHVLKHFDIEQNSRKMARIYRVLLGRTALFQGSVSETR